VGGNDTNFPAIFNWPVVEGSYFTAADERAAATVAVIGHRVREKLFKGEVNPIGQYILIENVPFQVIGVLAEKGASSGNKDSDDRVAIPYTAASVRLFGSYDPEYVVIAAADARKVQEAEVAIDQLMQKLHNGKRDYELTNNAAMIQAEARTQNTLSLMLGSIAAISLLVGGLLVLAKVAVLFSLVAVLGAFGCALVTGVVFGFMPARKAARLDPVKALTSE